MPLPNNTCSHQNDMEAHELYSKTVRKTTLILIIDDINGHPKPCADQIKTRVINCPLKSHKAHCKHKQFCCNSM